jgi:hypothetical protein
MVRLAFLAVACIVLTDVGSAAATIYSNLDYGFAVVVPDSLAVERDEPPRPDHGFSITLGRGR